MNLKNEFDNLDYLFHLNGIDNLAPLIFKDLMPLFVNNLENIFEHDYSLFEKLGYKFGTLSYPFSFSASFLSCVLPILKYVENIDVVLLNQIKSGEIIIANCATEPSSGSDVFSMKTTIKRENKEYIINGTKSFITNTDIANYALVYGKNTATNHIDLFLTKLDSNGIKINSSYNKSGLKNSSLGSISFENVFISESFRVSGKTSGKTIFLESMIWERLGVSAVHIGIIDKILRLCKSILEKNKKTNQNTWHEIAYCWAKLESIRALLHTSRYNKNTKILSTTSSMCKLLSSQLFVETANSVPNWLGFEEISDSVLTEFILDAPVTSIYSGTNEIQKEIIASNFKID